MARRWWLPGGLLVLVLLLGAVVPIHAQQPPGEENGVLEVEPNDTIETAQEIDGLSEIGVASPVLASIDTAGDTDWYAFRPFADGTYILEIYNVSDAFSASGMCDGAERDGLHVSISTFFSPSDTEPEISFSVCSPKLAAGEVLLQQPIPLEGGDGGPVLQVGVWANNADATGDYRLRVVPGWSGNPNEANWNSRQEPNNHPQTAFPIARPTLESPHALNPITSSITTREPWFLTAWPDRDYYRFDMQSGVRYTVELLNVDAAFAAEGQACATDGTAYQGLGLSTAFYTRDGEMERSTDLKCSPFGIGPVVNQVVLFSEDDTTGVIGVRPNAWDANGKYTLRIAPDYRSTYAAWDEAHEPNNHRYNAYALPDFDTDGITSLETSLAVPESSTYWEGTDRDYFRFQATEGMTYTAELLLTSPDLSDPCTEDSGFGLGVSYADGSFGNWQSLIAPTCGTPSGDVHASISFTALEETEHILAVSPNDTFSPGLLPPGSDGSYVLRVREGATASAGQRLYLPLLRR
jgi:hypothetical protein